MSRFAIARATTTTVLILLFVGACSAQERVLGAQVQRTVALQPVRVAAQKVAKKLTTVLGKDIVVFVHEETETVIIRANGEQIRRAREILKRLDVEKYNCIVSLKNADAATTARALMAIVALTQFLCVDSEVHVCCVDKGKAILIQSSNEKAAEVIAILRRFDAKAK